MEQHGMPGFIKKGDFKPQGTQLWRHSVRYNVANRYLLQVCVDYIGLLGGGEGTLQAHQASTQAFSKYSSTNNPVENEKDPIQWYGQVKKHPCGALLDYTARYWMTHYQYVRLDVDGYFDYL